MLVILQMKLCRNEENTAMTTDTHTTLTERNTAPNTTFTHITTMHAPATHTAHDTHNVVQVLTADSS